MQKFLPSPTISQLMARGNAEKRKGAHNPDGERRYSRNFDIMEQESWNREKGRRVRLETLVRICGA